MARRRVARTEEQVRAELSRCEAGVERNMRAVVEAANRMQKYRKRATYYRRRLIEMVNARMAEEASRHGREHRPLDLE